VQFGVYTQEHSSVAFRLSNASRCHPHAIRLLSLESLVSGKALRGTRSELPRIEDFASLEEYNLYHVRSMLAAGVSPDDFDLDFVLPSFVEAMQLGTEEEIRSSLAWKNTIEQLGLEKAECMLR
jgi:hypothetical protein